MRGKAVGLALPRIMASMMEGWSEPRLTKTCETPAAKRASKKAKEVVYMSGEEEAALGVGWVRGGGWGWEVIVAVVVVMVVVVDVEEECRVER